MRIRYGNWGNTAVNESRGGKIMNNSFGRPFLILVIIAMLALVYLGFVIGMFRLFINILGGLI